MTGTPNHGIDSAHVRVISSSRPNSFKLHQSIRARKTLETLTDIPNIILEVNTDGGSNATFQQAPGEDVNVHTHHSNQDQTPSDTANLIDTRPRAACGFQHTLHTTQ
ncbi:hypothetical protein FUT69_03745 [Xylella taiwanensis]|uniref:Uncharacterized protein n=1 Tax=Xylella taiwanensis TaxID=1444770 RepID=Z9JNR8_9GAMM|nr:hypothetical protein [Xylella taiwanensis]AXI84482.1 hypothetical protein AB672_11390 [Xylella taiwanensis]EWS79446.1 hypothetical protein AF72_00660 [Xylella taiwanensis]MCD8455382.1 hypothetical protein [Xylella taiwanensis]MCD8457786.1 hypothetical protein [Xylella taiwanensis]MCD8459922.1 hypothetical protein [Xylella taiwanensis]